MTQEQKNHIQQLAKEHFRYSFSHIKAKADSKGAHLEAYYLFLVDDFFAVGDAAISREAIKAYDPNASLNLCPRVFRFGTIDIIRKVKVLMNGSIVVWIKTDFFNQLSHGCELVLVFL